MEDRRHFSALRHQPVDLLVLPEMRPVALAAEAAQLPEAISMSPVNPGEVRVQQQCLE